MGAVTHLVFTARQADPDGSHIDRIVQARLIVPSDQLQEIGRAVLSGRLDPAAGVDENGEPVQLN